MFYALRRCLAEKRPVIWRNNKEYIFVWTLVDSDDSKSGIPEELICQGSRVFTIFATS
jgi:hypothetical protein